MRFRVEACAKDIILKGLEAVCFDTVARVSTSMILRRVDRVMLTPFPGFFTSADSKEFKFSVSRLESILAGGPGSADSKELADTNLH
jgi:hypothetical protein